MRYALTELAPSSCQGEASPPLTEDGFDRPLTRVFVNRPLFFAAPFNAACLPSIKRRVFPDSP
ncbi:MAG: hypothetical protein ACK5QI_05750, partial [Alphaproteobacteria bacterium]